MLRGLFFHATETAQWHGYFRLSDAVYIPFRCPFRHHV